MPIVCDAYRKKWFLCNFSKNVSWLIENRLLIFIFFLDKFMWRISSVYRACTNQCQFQLLLFLFSSLFSSFIWQQWTLFGRIDFNRKMKTNLKYPAATENIFWFILWNYRNIYLLFLFPFSKSIEAYHPISMSLFTKILLFISSFVVLYLFCGTSDFNFLISRTTTAHRKRVLNVRRFEFKIICCCCLQVNSHNRFIMQWMNIYSQRLLSKYTFVFFRCVCVCLCLCCRYKQASKQIRMNLFVEILEISIFTSIASSTRLWHRNALYTFCVSVSRYIPNQIESIHFIYLKKIIISSLLFEERIMVNFQFKMMCDNEEKCKPKAKQCEQKNRTQMLSNEINEIHWEWKKQLIIRCINQSTN